MVVPAKSPWNSLPDLVAAAKKEPGKYTYGSAGIGGSQHLAGAQFKTASGVDVRHVPYKGSGPAAHWPAASARTRPRRSSACPPP